MVSAGKVSIIIPLYNSEQYIKECIESCLAQDYKDLEIIIVDDGSTDRSKEIVGSFNDSRIRYLYQENSGAAAARNHGLKKSTGDYIQYLDSDDLLASNKISLQMEVLAKGSDLGLTSCSWGKFEDNINDLIINQEEVWKDYTVTVEWLIDSFSGGGMMQTACWLCSRKLIEKAGPWDENLSLHDDGEYFTRVILLAESITFVEDSLVYYRQVNSSLSRLRSKTAIKSAYLVAFKSGKYLLNNAENTDTRKAAATLLGRFAYEFYEQDKILAEKALGEMSLLLPKGRIAIGPGKMKILISILGLKRALHLKHALKKE